MGIGKSVSHRAAETDDTHADQLDLAAHHEAGHAMAAVMRGGSSLRAASIDLDRPGHGLTRFRSAQWDFGFIAYAGPWAEARFKWGDRPLDERDEDDCEFSGYVVGVLVNQPDDATAWRSWLHAPEQESLRKALADQGMTFAPEVGWERDLEAVWTQIQALATRIHARELVTDREVRALYHETLPRDGWAGDAELNAVIEKYADRSYREHTQALQDLWARRKLERMTR
ncbi:M50 family metallopeptidase [Tsukamurella strandjordii]|nr:hypothetical protein TTY48_21130 [Tsukamurella sp. TY48]